MRRGKKGESRTRTKERVAYRTDYARASLEKGEEELKQLQVGQRVYKRERIRDTGERKTTSLSRRKPVRDGDVDETRTDWRKLEGRIPKASSTLKNQRGGLLGKNRLYHPGEKNTSSINNSVGGCFPSPK